MKRNEGTPMFDVIASLELTDTILAWLAPTAAADAIAVRELAESTGCGTADALIG